MGGSDWRGLRYLRHEPPGYANPRGGGRRKTTFQAALEQCEQFIKAAGTADYTTRPVQLFYALSQGGRAVVAASPKFGSSDWEVHGHGLSIITKTITSLPDVVVEADEKADGLFQAMAKALGFDPLAVGDKIRLGDLWPLIPESIFEPLEKQETLSAIMFRPGAWPQPHPLYGAQLHWIRPSVPEMYGQDKDALANHFARYPALKGLSWMARFDVPWQISDGFASLDIHFDVVHGERPEVIRPGSRLAAKYGAQLADERFITPSIGSMTGPLHPVLAWWAVLLALSSLARYEPANWAKMIDVNSSKYATAVEHLLDDATVRIPEMLLNILTNIEDPG